MNANNNLQRFIDAQKNDYEIALSEIKIGRKHSHWMWYIFPQVAGLGFSSTSKYYAIKDLEEAKDYLENDVLGNRLKIICNELLKLDTSNATEVFGTPDDMKLCSSMTLFASVTNADKVFTAVLKKFFNGKKDVRTLELIHTKREI